MLKAQNVMKRFDQLQVLQGVTAEIQRGQVVAIIGQSGSGKSTFLRCLNHLETIDSGRIEIDGEVMVDTNAAGQAIYAPKKVLRKICLKMGMVFQSYHLFPHYSVLKNLMDAQIHVLGRPKNEAKDYALALLEKVGLSDKAKQYPYQLSGGQSQRVAIARALALDPAILCFDEPTSALDPQLTQEVLGVIRSLAEEKRTMIVVTHEMAFAREVADHVIFMMEGKIMEQGPAREMLGQAKSERLRAFMGEV